MTAVRKNEAGFFDFTFRAGEAENAAPRSGVASTQSEARRRANEIEALVAERGASPRSAPPQDRASPVTERPAPAGHLVHPKHPEPPTPAKRPKRSVAEKLARSPVPPRDTGGATDDLVSIRVDADENLRPARSTERAPRDDHRLGHRKRLRKRFLEGGRSAVADYELLELVLFRAMPQRDMKPTAKAVLARFGTFSEALNAPDRELMTINGIGEAAIAEFRIVRAAALQFLRDEVVERPLLTSWDGVLDYCRASMSYESREQFRVIFLDKRNRIITDEVQQVGTVDHTPVYTREVMKRALELSATALILVHNHPSGDPEPSRADIAMTKLIADTAKNLGIVIHDHIVIGREGHVSFKAKGLL